MQIHMNILLYKSFQRVKSPLKIHFLAIFNGIHRGKKSTCGIWIFLFISFTIALSELEVGGKDMATIGQLMTRDLSFVSEDASIQEAAKYMHAKRIGSLLVKKESDFSGIVTETDVVQAVAEQPGEVVQLTVKGLMSSPIITVDRNMSPNYARDLMADRKIRHLAVTEESGKIVGIISVRDLLAYFKTVSKDLEKSEENG